MDTLSRANQPTARLEQLAQAPLPTRHGMFQVRVFRWDDPGAHPALSREHCALIMGDVRGRLHVPVRVHSECLTGEVFSSLKCDCREQFDHAQAAIAKHGFGVILYLRQEGRGIGLANKVRAYAPAAMGADTVEETSELLHLPVDARTYDVAAAMLRHLGVESIDLLTNNPTKVDELRRLGVTVDKLACPCSLQPIRSRPRTSRSSAVACSTTCRAIRRLSSSQPLWSTTQFSTAPKGGARPA